MAEVPWFCLVLFSAAFTATILATPWVITFARQSGALDSPDGFRKHQKTATPRMGGLAVAFGVTVALICYYLFVPQVWAHLEADFLYGGVPTLAAIALVIAIGLLDDCRGMGAMPKLAGQAAVAALLYLDGFRIDRIFVLGYTIDFGLLSLPATIFWFLGCLNIWNLIDGMDGLASGVGTIVAVTLMLAATTLGHLDVAYSAAALAGALAGFLIYNFHPAKIFLGDTGSLLIGLMLGMLAVRGSLKSGMTVAILVPILAMGLPIVDTSLAIMRRWIRHLPFSVADRGHLHHRLMAFGLSQRQASLFLYSFTVLLCAAALASVGLQSDSLAVLFGALGAIGLGVVFAVRREENQSLLNDVKQRFLHRRVERKAACVTWEAIQRMANVTRIRQLVEIVESLAQELSCESLSLVYRRGGDPVVKHFWASDEASELDDASAERQETTVSFALKGWPGEELVLEFRQQDDARFPLCLAGRFLSRLTRELLAHARRCLTDHLDPDDDGARRWVVAAEAPVAGLTEDSIAVSAEVRSEA